MKEFYNNLIAENFYKTDLSSIDEFILVNGEFGLHNPENIIRKINFDVNGNEIFEQEIELFKIDVAYATLNYSEFIHDFDAGLFWYNIQQSEILLIIENEFKSYCLHYLDSHQNFKVVPILLKEIIEYTNDVIKELNGLQNTNSIQSEVINYFTNLYSEFINFLSERYKSIYPDAFLKISCNSDSLEFMETEFSKYFKNNGFEFFEILLSEFKIYDDRSAKKNKHYRDFSYIYRRMKNDGYIDEDFGISKFTNAFCNEYNIIYENPKTLEYIGNIESKSKVYNSLKSNFKKPS